MTRAVPKLNVYEAINQVSLAMSRDGIGKSRKNEQQGYAFRGIDDMYNALSIPLASFGLCIIPRFRNRSVTERTTQKGGVLFYVVVEGEFDLVGPDGSKHTAMAFGEAMDSADKATNKAMSAAFKYMCMQLFCIPTEGDNDADASTHVLQARAQEVAQRKIKDLSVPKQDPDYEQRHAAVVTELADFLDTPPEVPPDPRAKPAVKPKSIMSFEALKEWGVLKTELRKLSGTDAIYYAALKAKGYERANTIANKEDAANIWKVLATERTRIKGDAELKETLTGARERIGGVKFLEILGANGCESIADALLLSGTALDALLGELKLAVDDIKGTA